MSWKTASGRSVAQTLAAAVGPAKQASRQRVHETAVLFHAELVKTLSTPGRGKPRRAKGRAAKWLRSRNAKTRAKGLAFQHGNRASRPGDPPAPDTNRLRGSAYYRMVGEKAQTGVATVYARALDKGYPRRNLAARPFMKPTLERVKRILASKGIHNVTFTQGVTYKK